MIGGFILQETNKVIIRAIGPSLAQPNVSNVVGDPTLDLRNAHGTRLFFNDS